MTQEKSSGRGRMDPDAAARILFSLLPHGGSASRAPQGFGQSVRNGQPFSTFMARQQNRGNVELREDDTFVWLRNPGTGEVLGEGEAGAEAAEQAVRALVYHRRMPALERARVFFLEMRGAPFVVSNKAAAAGFDAPLSARRFAQQDLLQRYALVRRSNQDRDGVHYLWTSKAYELWGHLLRAGDQTAELLDPRVHREAVERVLAAVAAFRAEDRRSILSEALKRAQAEAP